MAENPSNTLTYFVSLNLSQKKLLGKIRLWENLKIAYDQNLIWIKDLTEDQSSSVEIMSIPGSEVYYQRENKLFKTGSLLPSCNTPSLLWTPIHRAFPVSFPSYNDNFFGVGEQSVNIELTTSNIEKDPYVLKVAISDLNVYIETAPQIRLKNLKWTLISSTDALIFGTPLLPLKGEVYWKQDRLLLPIGYRLNYPILMEYICKKYHVGNDWLCWLNKDECAKIKSTLIEDLTLSSFRKTMMKQNITENEL